MNLSTFLRDLQVTAGIPRGLARILGAPRPGCGEGAPPSSREVMGTEKCRVACSPPNVPAALTVRGLTQPTACARGSPAGGGISPGKGTWPRP